MFGYATDETEELMPMSIMLAHKVNRRMADLRRSGGLPWARPDSKSQVSKIYIHQFILGIQMRLRGLCWTTY